MEQAIKEIIINALNEDGYHNDVTTDHLLSDDIMATGYLIAKEGGILSGIDIAKEVFLMADPEINFQVFMNNSSKLKQNDIIASISGHAKSILKAERVALNILQRMSGIATTTRQYVNEVEEMNVLILDTRKTTPLVRILEKRAVIDGGGINHRFNLSDMVMIKENHISTVGSITVAVNRARQAVGQYLEIEVEVENKEQFLEAQATDCNRILLDNMPNELMAELVLLNHNKKHIEASGNMTLDRVQSVASTGVDSISVGALTHSYRSMDISLRLDCTKKQI